MRCAGRVWVMAVFLVPLGVWAQKASVPASAPAPSPSPSPAAAPEPLRHGIVKFDGKGALTLVTTGPLPTGGDVHFQYPGETGETACCRRLPLSAFKKVTLPPAGTATEMGAGRPLVAKAARVSAQDADMPFVGAAVLGEVQSVKMAPGDGLVARAKDGRSTASTTCVSTEGFQVIEKAPSGKAGAAKGSKGRAHLYLNLGYEVEESTCR
ncbi:MAG: hypothetical protein WAQ08_01170 [Aquabacterium sp.]|uniref:hypothetical protein n=1 Tax=Aquabacterium sp. TaxID=1872578 RepID=UPI003BB0EC57